MGYGILLIIAGLLCIFLQKTKWHKNYIIRHNFMESEEFFRFIKNVIGGILIFLGTIFFINIL